MPGLPYVSVPIPPGLPPNGRYCSTGIWITWPLRALKGLICIACKTGSGCLPEAGVRKERWMRRPSWRICFPKSVNIFYSFLYTTGWLLFPSASIRCLKSAGRQRNCRYVRSRLSFTEQAFCREAALPVRVWRIPISWSVGSIGNVSIWDLAAMLYWIWRLPMWWRVWMHPYLYLILFRMPVWSR